jgi:hypothetical protein
MVGNSVFYERMDKGSLDLAELKRQGISRVVQTVGPPH